MNQEYVVDLGGHPPYHQPPEGFKMPSAATSSSSAPAAPNGNGLINPATGAPFSSDSGSDADSSMTSSTATTTAEAVAAATDGNRNFT